MIQGEGWYMIRRPIDRWPAEAAAPKASGRPPRLRHQPLGERPER